jgi:uncharacterized protein YdhG (YjbR/CyaY superfamily)
MQAKSAIAPDVDAYIAGFPKPTQALLGKIRAAIRKAAPEADEGIGYQMPAYKFHGPLVYFAGYDNHIGFYPGAAGIAHFKKEIAAYKSAKGSVQFPLDQPMPLDLVARIVAFRVGENGMKAKTKAAAKSTPKAKSKAAKPEAMVKAKARTRSQGKSLN